MHLEYDIAVQPTTNMIADVNNAAFVGDVRRWAMHEGYGACLLQKPQLLAEMITAAKSRVSGLEDFTVSIKIRLHDNIK